MYNTEIRTGIQANKHQIYCLVLVLEPIKISVFAKSESKCTFFRWCQT